MKRNSKSNSNYIAKTSAQSYLNSDGGTKDGTSVGREGSCNGSCNGSCGGGGKGIKNNPTSGCPSSCSAK